MITFNRTGSNDPDFMALTGELDRELLQQYQEQQAMYAPHNKMNNLQTVIVAYSDGVPAGCGCFKKAGEAVTELKRMFVRNAYRGLGIGASILKELELWAKESGYNYMILETGIKQKEAIGLYQKNGYRLIENYGPYAGLEDSICMKKSI
jgi:putative acetyltransferase